MAVGLLRGALDPFDDLLAALSGWPPHITNILPAP